MSRKLILTIGLVATATLLGASQGMARSAGNGGQGGDGAGGTPRAITAPLSVVITRVPPRGQRRYYRNRIDGCRKLHESYNPFNNTYVGPGGALHYCKL